MFKNFFFRNFYFNIFIKYIKLIDIYYKYNYYIMIYNN